MILSFHHVSFCPIPQTSYSLCSSPFLLLPQLFWQTLPTGVSFWSRILSWQPCCRLCRSSENTCLILLLSERCCPSISICEALGGSINFWCPRWGFSSNFFLDTLIGPWLHGKNYHRPWHSGLYLRLIPPELKYLAFQSLEVDLIVKCIHW